MGKISALAGPPLSFWDRSNSIFYLYAVAASFYMLAVWLHAPSGGGNMYTDITSVFLRRECLSITCQIQIPYIQTFVEYPVIVSMFMYAMGVLGNQFLVIFNSGSVLSNYYYLTVAFLSIPTILLIREILKIGQIVGYSSVVQGRTETTNTRVLRYVVATPSFVFMLLINWYVIGVYFAVFGLRKFLRGSRWGSGALIGLSAASNLVTAIPALGMFLTANNWRERITFGVAATLVYGIINLPFLLVNPHLWFLFWQYHYQWGIEGSWMLAFLPTRSPLRHYIFPILFVLLSALIVFSFFRFNKKREKEEEVVKQSRVNGTIRYSWLLTFAFLFSTYVCTAQMNLILLPFFSVVPIVRRYGEFLAFDSVNSGIGAALFYLILPVFGITYSYLPLVFLSATLAGILRSFWTGKILLVNGILFPYLRGTTLIAKSKTLLSLVKSMAPKRIR